MSDSNSLFSGFRQRRLQSLAARFSQAPAEAWGGIDALPALFHEQLTLGRRFSPPLQAFARFTPESAAPAAEVLDMVSRASVLTSLSADFDDPDYLTVWELLENAAQSLSLLSPITTLGTEASDLGQRLASEMQRMPGSDPSTPVDALAEGLRLTLSEWSSHAPSSTPGEARLLFLGLLYRHVISAFPAPANFWEILLLKLELAIASPGTAPSLSRLLAPVFRAAWSALPIQPALHTFWSIHSESTGADLIAAERISTLAVLARSGGSSASVLRFALTPEWVASTPPSLTADAAAPWRSSLAQHLELAAYQPLLEAADHWRRLVAASSEIPAAITPQLPALRKIADDLAQGMPGKDTADLFVSLATELLARGLWVATLTSNPAEARELFLLPAVRELGLDASAGLWKKLSRLSSGLQQLVAPLPPSWPWAQLPPLLRALEARATETKTLPVRWSDPVPESTFAGLPFAAADGPARCARDVGHLLSRLVIEQRIHGTQRGGIELSRWYAINVLPRLAHLPDEAFRERWDVLAESGLSPKPEHTSLNLAARRFGHTLPRLTAAWKLELHAEELATSIADEVMATLPDYAEKVGPTGRVSCIRDNTLTLRQVANLLLSDTDSPHEVLAEWWNSAVGSYLATRPARLFEVNLAAIYHALNRELDPAEVSAAFTPIQIVYRESLGIECLEALTGAPTAVAGPLARRLVAGFSAPEVNRDTLSLVLRSALLDQKIINPKTYEAFLSTFLAYHRERWSSGDSDTAAARFLPLLTQPSLARHRAPAAVAILNCAADPSVASAPHALLLAESADDFALVLAQSGVAAALVEHAPEIAEAFAAAMVTHAPDHFKHLSPEDATTRCQRDQTLLLRNLGDRLSRTAPGLFWIDATRWFLELLSPFVQYPSYVWALSSRTVAKHLGPRLSPLENIFLARWTTHFEHLAAGWSASHALAKKAFNPTDYSFSARPEEDRLQRDLLAAALAARFAPTEGPWSGQALFHRFLLSWPASTRSSEEIATLLANLVQVSASTLPPGVASWLDRTPAAIAALLSAEGPHPAARYAHATKLPAAREIAKALDLALADGPELGLWRHLRSEGSAVPGLSPALAQAAVRAHLLHPFDSQEPRALASSFPSAVRARTGLISSGLSTSCEAADWSNLANTLLPHAASANTLRSHFTTLALEWPAVQSGIALAASASSHADQLLGPLSEGKDVPYSQSAPECNQNTNALSFAFAFRQTGTAAWDAATEPPRLFFGFAADNHRLLSTLVASRAHARVNAAMRKLMPVGSALGGDAILGLEAPLFSSTGPLWHTLALDSRSPSPSYVGALFPAIRPIAEDAASYAFPSNPSLRSTTADRLCFHLEALACGLEESGDIESAWELLLLRLTPDLEVLSSSELIAAFYGLTRDLSKHLSAGPALFWRTCLLGTLEVVRQAALGRYLQTHAADLAASAASAAVPNDADLRGRCARDQEHLLAATGHFLATQAPVRAWLNLSSHLTEITLPHLSHGALELASIWCRHENILSPRLDPVLRPALWTWFGTLQRTSRNLPAVRPFVAQAVPSLSASLAEQHGDNPADWRRFLSALAAAAATPDDGPAPGQAIIEKALLSSPLGLNHAPATWAALSESIANTCETLLPGRVPNSLKRRLLALPPLASRLDALTAGKGSRLVRACAAQASHPMARPLWQASLLARARPDDSLVDSDPADAYASSAFGTSLEPDEVVLARFAALRASLGAGATLPLAPAKSGGFLAKLGLGKKPFDWANSPGLRIEGTYVLEILTLRAALTWPDSTHLWYWSCPRTLESIHPDKEVGTLAFYHALAVSAVARLGASHPGATGLAAFASDLSARFAGLKLALPSTEAVPGPLPLHLLGLRLPADAPAYAHLAPFNPDTSARLLDQARAQGRPLTDDQADLVRRAHDELLRSVS